MELPLGATEDRICGTIDIEKALQEGIKAYEPGLLVLSHPLTYGQRLFSRWCWRVPRLMHGGGWYLPSSDAGRHVSQEGALGGFQGLMWWGRWYFKYSDGVVDEMPLKLLRCLTQQNPIPQAKAHPGT